MDLLPELADTIEDDMENLGMSDKTEPVIQQVEEIDSSPFIEKPTTKNTKPQKQEKVKEITDTETESDVVEKPKKTRKPRKPLTDKQKETLAKNRAKALETRRLKAEAKKKAVQDAVKSIDEKRKSKKVQQSNLDNIQNDVMEKDQPKAKTELDVTFNEKIQANKDVELKQKHEDEEKHFMRFMEHMEKFNTMVHTYTQNKPKPQPKPQPQKPKIHQAKPQVTNPKPVAKPTIITQPSQPFESDNWFG